MEAANPSTNKKVSLDELSKDELIKKCNNLLLIAKKAKQAKDESSEELKKYKENEHKLSSDVAALKEVVESFNKKQNEFAEVQNKHKITEEKNSELQKDFKKLEENYVAKITECSNLEQTLKKLSDKISVIELSKSENFEKLSQLKINYKELNDENNRNLEKLNIHEQREIDLKKKLQNMEEKYIKLELTLKEFQGRFIEESKNHEELQEALIKLQNKNSSGRCSSRSSDSLRPLYENQEYDEILEKYNDLMEKSRINNLEMEKLNKKLVESENTIAELSSKYNNLLKEHKAIQGKVEVLVNENDILQKDINECERMKHTLKVKETEVERLSLELNEKNKLVSDRDALVKDNLNLQEEMKNLKTHYDKIIDDLNQKLIHNGKITEDFQKYKMTLHSMKIELESEKIAKIKALEELDKLNVALNEKNNLLIESTSANKKLTERIAISDETCNNLKLKLRGMTENQNDMLQRLSENEKSRESFDEVERKYANEMKKLTNVIKQQEALIKEKVDMCAEKSTENEKILRELREKEYLINELKSNYESAILEKDKLVEMCQSDISTEKIFTSNIAQLKNELMSLRQENDAADKRYKEMEEKLEESQVISELLKKEIDGKCDEYDAFKKEVEFYRCQNDELKKEILKMEDECFSYKTNCDKLTKSEKEKMNELENLKRYINSCSKSISIIQEEFDKLEEEFIREKAEKTNSQNSNSSEEISLEDENFKIFVQKHANKIDFLKILDALTKAKNYPEISRSRSEHVDTYTQTEGFGHLQNDGILLDKEIKSKIKSLLITVRDIKSIKCHIIREIRECFSSIRADYIQFAEHITKNVGDIFCNLQNGNSELLKEMNDMNQALKERGEVISGLEKINESQHKDLLEAGNKITQLHAKLTDKKNKMKQIMDEWEEIKLEVENKEKTIKEMEEEIWKLRNNDSTGEALSSSTLSRVEEAARLMDVEESFEDRYSKLKVIAAKLKKKTTEQQKQLEEERNRSIAKSNEYQTKIANFQSQIKTLMNLQSEYDRLQDTLEEEKNEKNKLRKAAETANEKIEAFRQEVDNLKKEKDKLLGEKNSFDKIKKKLSAQIITLKSSLEEEKSKQTKLLKEIEKVEHEKTLSERKLEEEKENHKSTITQLEKQKMESKNLGVLKLEITEYEKSVTDLEKKLAMKEENTQELNTLLENQQSQCRLYLDEINNLKLQLTKENERADEANRKVEKFNEESSNRQVEIKEKVNEIGNLRISLEEKKREAEEISLELAKIGKEKLKIEEKYKTIQDRFSQEVNSSQDKLLNLQELLNQRDLELNELKKEFDAYKVRAQSVLRQSQKDINQSKQRNVLEELEQVKNTSESLKARLAESGLKIQKLIEENEVFQEEKTRLYTRIQELKNSLAGMREENEELKTSKQKELENFNESLKLQKLQSETLAHCFQKKIEELEANHKKEMDELTNDNKQLQKQFQRVILSTSGRPCERRDGSEPKVSSAAFIPVKTEKEILDVMLLEREECEGSESVDSISPQTGNNSNLIPLDQLLNSSDNPDQLENISSPINTVQQLSEKLDKSENRIKHLTVLLSEAETDCARLQHLNDLLKEEIRRNQRNAEREQHAQNFEYMKNVMLKFISLHNTDEKIRLVPVLNTILKLSPEEEIILSNAARGIVESSNRGWGSYLNIWPSTQ